MIQNIKRQKYLDQILPTVGKNIIKVLIWQRRVGKSFVLLSLIDTLTEQKKLKKGEFIYINKEQSERDHIKNYSDLNEECADYQTIFVDEVQDIIEREKAIRNLRSLGKDIYITGSNAHLLSGELSTYLSGRYIHFDIYPLDFKEFTEFYNLVPDKTTFQKYMQYGGMPYVLQFGFDQMSVNYSKDVYSTIILKDIVRRYKIRNVAFFEDLIEFIARNVWSIFSSLKISNYLAEQKVDISPKVINEYLHFANNALFLHSVDRYDIASKKIFERKQKHYFTDIGIRNCMFDYNIKDISKILENIVFSNLIANGYKVFVGEVWTKEIDFIAEKNNQKIYVQVCYLLANPETVEREFWAYENVKDGRPRYVVSLDDIIGAPDEWVTHMNIFDFLQNVVCK